MNLSIAQPALKAALALAGNAINKNSVNPMLRNVLLVADKGTLRITGQDLPLHVAAEAAADIHDPGAVALPYDKLHAIVARLTDAPIHIDINGNKAIIKSKRNRYTLAVYSAEDYPERNTPTGEIAQLTLPAAEFSQALARVQHAMGIKDVRDCLNGTLLDVKRNLLRAVATDGHRMACADITVQADIEGQAILPRKSVLALLSILKHAKPAELTLTLARQEVLVSADGLRVGMTKVAQRYPNYARLLEKDAPNRLAVVPADLAQAVSQVTPIIDINGTDPIVRLDIAEDHIDVCLASVGGESANASIDAAAQQPISLGLNAKYMLDAISAVSDIDDTLFSLGDDKAPFILHTPNRSVVQLLMPAVI